MSLAKSWTVKSDPSFTAVSCCVCTSLQLLVCTSMLITRPLPPWCDPITIGPCLASPRGYTYNMHLNLVKGVPDVLSASGSLYVVGHGRYVNPRAPPATRVSFHRLFQCAGNSADMQCTSVACLLLPCAIHARSPVYSTDNRVPTRSYLDLQEGIDRNSPGVAAGCKGSRQGAWRHPLPFAFPFLLVQDESPRSRHACAGSRTAPRLRRGTGPSPQLTPCRSRRPFSSRWKR